MKKTKWVLLVLLLLIGVGLFFVFRKPTGAPLIYLNKPELYTVSIALRSFTDPNSFTDYGAMFAMTALSLAPVLIVFAFFQRYLIEGISTTGLKG